MIAVLEQQSVSPAETPPQPKTYTYPLIQAMPLFTRIVLCLFGNAAACLEITKLHLQKNPDANFPKQNAAQ